MTRPPASPFRSRYADARHAFLEAAGAAGAAVSSHPHPLAGRDGERLALDVAVDGDPAAPAVLVVSSGCHGVEGFCGSGVQVAALRDRALADRARDRGIALLHLHALNPFGFSHLRRTTEDNVDLNRNFHDFTRPLPVNEAYRELHPLLVPAAWPPDADNQARIGRWIAARSPAHYQAAISRGQHEFADGLFFGGTRPTWSNPALRDALRRHAAHARRIGWIDVHTGLGPLGVGERIFANRDDAAALARTRSWWGERVTSIYDGTSASAYLTGLMWQVIPQECPAAEYTGIALEFGTAPIDDVLQALRADQWLHAHPDAAPALAESIKRQLFEVFFVDSDPWRAAVLRQAEEAMRQAIDGLAG